MSRRLCIRSLTSDKRLFVTLVVALTAACLLPPLITRAGSQYEYTSDYFSFVGRDKKGLVAFAIDNNRGRAADRYQAEHFVKLYDQLQGWVSISGNGGYGNTRRQLRHIPDSADFRFTGDAENGLTISSPTNAIELSMPPIPKTVSNANDQGSYWLGGAPATLRWKERVIGGRVIYEYLHWNRFNRLAGKSPGRFKNFNGLYLMTGAGADFYLHHRESDRLRLTGMQAGFADWHGAARLSDITFRVTDRDIAPGFYRWPAAWTGRFTYKARRYRFELKTVDRDIERNWVIGGFAMAIVEGHITSVDGLQHLPVVGLAELIM